MTNPAVLQNQTNVAYSTRRTPSPAQPKPAALINADQYLPLLEEVCRLTGLSPVQVATRFAEFIKMAEVQHGQVAKDVNTLMAIMSTNKADPLVQLFLTQRRSVHEMGNLLHIVITLGHGSEAKNDLAGILLTGSANSDMEEHIADSYLVAQMHENFQNPNRDSNTPFIESADPLGNALKYYQRAADGGYAGAAEKVAEMQQQISAALMQLAQNLVAAAPGSDKDVAKHDQDVARSERAMARHKNTAEQIQAQITTTSESFAKTAVKAQQQAEVINTDANNKAYAKAEQQHQLKMAQLAQ